MKNSKYLLTFLLLSVTYLIVFSTALLAQNKMEYFPGSFHSVKAGGIKKIVLVQSDSNKIECFGENASIEYKLNEGVLDILKTKNILKADLIKIYSPQFNSLEFSIGTDVKCENTLNSDSLKIVSSGASDIEMNVVCNYLYIKLSGASDVKLIGQAKKFVITTSGASDVKAYGLKTMDAIVKASGASDIKINADSSIVAKLTGASSLKYEKEPKTKEIDMNDSPMNIEDLVVEIEKDSIIIRDNNSDEDNDDDMKSTKFKGNWSGIEFGINGYLTPDLSLEMPANYQYLSLSYPRSNNFNINFYQQSIGIIGNKFGIVTGLGLHWNNYRFDKNMVFDKDSAGITGTYVTASNRSYIKSKLTSSYLVLPLLLEFQTNNDHNLNSFHLSAGVIGGVRLASHTKQVYDIDGGESKPKVYDDFYLNPYKLDATARIGWGKLNIYTTYSLIEMFRANKGPKLNPFSIGLSFPLS